MLNERNSNDVAIDMVSIVAGVALFLSPWLFGFSAAAAASWNAWIAGLLIVIVGVWTIANYQAREDWLNLALGAWTIVAPWLLGFAAVGSAVTMHVVVGLIVVALAILELWRSNNRPLSPA